MVKGNEFFRVEIYILKIKNRSMECVAMKNKPLNENLKFTKPKKTK